AGLRRLNMADQATGILEPTEMLPAVAQGAVGITCRTEDSDILARLAPLDHAETTLCVQAERAMLATLDGSCRTPIGGLASLSEDGQTLSLEGLVIKPDGSATHRTSQTGPAADPIALGQAVGQALLERMGPDFLSLPQKSAASAAPSGTPIATDPEA
ncbi:MAG: hydroxymethylbilane synthase, partial [Rhodospirillaceae bacterium]